MSEPTIPFGRPVLDESEIDSVTEVLRGSCLVHGPVSAEFERVFAARVGCRAAATVSSCTAGLHLLLHGRGIGPGDEVIVPALSHVATAHVAEYTGATPVFADVDSNTGNIDPGAAEDAVTERTKAIVVVHYLGLPCEMDRLRSIARRKDLLLVEDCALALDAEYDGVKTGALGDAGSFSFYPAKHMTTGEGGMVTSADTEVIDQVRQLRAFGYSAGLGERKIPGIYDVVALGYNLRMSEVHAAIGLAQMAKLDTFQQARLRNQEVLRGLCREIEGIHIPPRRHGKAVSSNYCVNIVLEHECPIPRRTVMEHLLARGIGFSVHYPSAIPMLSYYRERYGFVPGQFPVAEWYASATISLPVGPHLRPSDMERIGEAVVEALSGSD